jgi:hypothetical protein
MSGSSGSYGLERLPSVRSMCCPELREHTLVVVGDVLFEPLEGLDAGRFRDVLVQVREFGRPYPRPRVRY